MKLRHLKDIAMISANFTYAISMLVECYIKLFSANKGDHPHEREDGHKN